MTTPTDLHAQYPEGATVPTTAGPLFVAGHDHASDGAPVLVCVRNDPRERPIRVRAEDIVGTRSPVVYVSGPMTGLPDLGHGAIKAMTAKLRAAGLTVICPTETPKPVRADGAEPTHADWVRASLRRLMGADAIVMLDGWEQSRGCRVEFEAACAAGIFQWQGVLSMFSWDAGRAP